MFGYACHNTTMQFYEWCGDYAGLRPDRGREEAPRRAGDVLDRLRGRRQPAARGARSSCASSTARNSPGPSRTRLREADPARPTSSPRSYAEIELPFDTIPGKDKLGRPTRSSKTHAVRDARERMLEEARSGARSRTATRITRSQVWRFGDQLTWVALGGEVVVDYNLRLKKELAGKRPLWITGYANDVMAYIPSARVLKEGGYEADSSQIYYGQPDEVGAGDRGQDRQQGARTGEVSINHRDTEAQRRRREEPQTIDRFVQLSSLCLCVSVVNSSASPTRSVAEGRTGDLQDAPGLQGRAGRQRAGRRRPGGDGASTSAAGCSSARCAATRTAASAPATRTAAASSCLEDEDGDGVFETSTVFADGLRFPTGVMPWKGGLHRRQRPGHHLPRRHRRRRQGRQDDGPLHRLRPRQHPADGQQPAVGDRQLGLRHGRQRRRHDHLPEKPDMKPLVAARPGHPLPPRRARQPGADVRRRAVRPRPATSAGTGSSTRTASTCGRSSCPTITCAATRTCRAGGDASTSPSTGPRARCSASARSSVARRADDAPQGRPGRQALPDAPNWSPAATSRRRARPCYYGCTSRCSRRRTAAASSSATRRTT